MNGERQKVGIILDRRGHVDSVWSSADMAQAYLDSMDDQEGCKVVEFDVFQGFVH